MIEEEDLILCLQIVSRNGTTNDKPQIDNDVKELFDDILNSSVSD